MEESVHKFELYLQISLVERLLKEYTGPPLTSAFANQSRSAKNTSVLLYIKCSTMQYRWGIYAALETILLVS
jgi:hypothetical protein